MRGLIINIWLLLLITSCTSFNKNTDLQASKPFTDIDKLKEYINLNLAVDKVKFEIDTKGGGLGPSQGQFVSVIRFKENIPEVYLVPIDDYAYLWDDSIKDWFAPWLKDCIVLSEKEYLPSKINCPIYSAEKILAKYENPWKGFFVMIEQDKIALFLFFGD
jgi:hypothetical protein